MRKVLKLSALALVLASAGAARAQQSKSAPPAPPAPPAAKSQEGTGPLTVFDVGLRASWVDGDQARWERYRDLRNGPVVGGLFTNENDRSAMELRAANVGYHDQEYGARYNVFGKLKLSADWNSIPLNYSYESATPWQYKGNNVWSLDATTRSNVQNKVPGVLGIGSTAAQYNLPSVYRSLAKPFDMQSRRDIVSAGLQFRASPVLALSAGLKTAARAGSQPFGASFAFNNGNELPIRLDDRTTDVTAGLEWAKAGRSMLRFEWLGSRYKNQFQSLTWDNPLRATDFSNGKAPPDGPYDPSGYSNGNGPAFGRMALPPSNTMQTFSMTGLQRLSPRTTLNGQLAYTMMRQDEALIPWTTNTVIVAALPHFAQLPRATAQGDINVLSGVLNFMTRPSNTLALDARLRYNKRDNRTPAFDGTEYIRFDAVPEEAGFSVAHDITRTNLETGATLSGLRGLASMRFAYILNDVQQTGRVYGGLRDNTFRVTFDTYGSQLFTVRGSIESTTRKGRDFSLEALEEGGAQEGLRFYDEAPFDRTAGSLNLQLNPASFMDVGLILAAGKDVYNAVGQEFGLLNNSNTSVNLNLDLYPADGVTLGGTFGLDEFKALQESRNANPLSGVAGAYESWTDPMRNWAVDNDETVKSFGLFLDLPKALPGTDIRLNFDQSASDNGFNFSGPRINALALNYAPNPADTKACGATATAPCFIPFAPVTNTWRRLRLDVTHMFNAKYGFSAAYSFDKLDIEDFATADLPDGSPRIDPLGEISTGYGNRPYQGQTLMLRFIYRFQKAAPVM